MNRWLIMCGVRWICCRCSDGFATSVAFNESLMEISKFLFGFVVAFTCRLWAWHRQRYDNTHKKSVFQNTMLMMMRQPLARTVIYIKGCQQKNQSIRISNKPHSRREMKNPEPMPLTCIHFDDYATCDAFCGYIATNTQWKKQKQWQLQKKDKKKLREMIQKYNIQIQFDWSLNGDNIDLSKIIHKHKRVLNKLKIDWLLSQDVQCQWKIILQPQHCRRAFDSRTESMWVIHD